MSGEVFEEDVLYDVIDYFNNNLDTYLTAIETLKADGIALADIKRYEVGDKDPYSINSHPGCLVFPGEAPYDPMSLAADLMRMQIILTIVVKAGKTENLTIKALRYAAAFRQCIDADRTAGGAVDRAAVSRVIPYARPPGVEDTMVVDIILETEKEIPR